MNWFWHALWICLVVIPVTVLWVACVFDLIFRRHNVSGWKRLLLLLMVLVVPVVGALIYASFMFGGPQLGSPGDQLGQDRAANEQARTHLPGIT